MKLLTFAMYALRKRKHLKISVDESTPNSKRSKINSKIFPVMESKKSNQNNLKPAEIAPIDNDAKINIKLESNENSEEVKSKYFLNTDEESKKPFSPKNWETQFNNIKEMRSQRNAPVDSMGAAKCVSENSSGKQRRFEILVALLLSSQTKDQVTHAAMTRLMEHNLTVQNILTTPEKEIGKLLYPVGFYNTKAASLKKIATILNDNYSDDIPSTYKELIALPGIGPKMAHLALTAAWGNCQGISVDIHVHRISNRLKWTPKPTKKPENTRKALEDWLPKNYWSEVNLLLVGFGQQICRPVYPLCHTCLNRKICPSSRNKR